MNLLRKINRHIKLIGEKIKRGVFRKQGKLPRVLSRGTVCTWWLEAAPSENRHWQWAPEQRQAGPLLWLSGRIKSWMPRSLQSQVYIKPAEPSGLGSWPRTFSTEDPIAAIYLCWAPHPNIKPTHSTPNTTVIKKKNAPCSNVFILPEFQNRKPQRPKGTEPPIPPLRIKGELWSWDILKNCSNSKLREEVTPRSHREKVFNTQKAGFSHQSSSVLLLEKGLVTRPRFHGWRHRQTLIATTLTDVANSVPSLLLASFATALAEI